MKTIRSLKDVTTLEVGDEVVFGNLEYIVSSDYGYFLMSKSLASNDKIFKDLGISKVDFVKNLGINTPTAGWIFPEFYSLEALTAVVSALFKEYEKQKNDLPKTWEEFCEKNPIKAGECFINRLCNVCDVEGATRYPDIDRNYCTSKQEAEAFLSLMQLRQLRKAYVKDWEPDWRSRDHYKYCIEVASNRPTICKWTIKSHALSFPTYELAEQFL